VIAAQVDVVHLADHPLLFAVPVLIPALVVVLLVVGIVVRDRRSGPVDESTTEHGAEPRGRDGAE
jgi:hypothetical protein